MSDKITLQSVASIDNSLLTAINNNNATLTTAIDNTLSRNGQSPNQMQSVLDMNSNPIINIPFATAPTQPVALGQIANPVTLIPALTGDVSGSFNGTVIPTTLATVNSNVGTFGSASQIPVVTVNAKGLTTAASTVTVAAPTNISNSQLATMANNTVKGNVSGGTTIPSDLNTTQLTTLVNQFTSSLSGAVPGSGGGTTNFLRADGTWTTPAGGTGVPTIQALTAGTTYTPTSGTVWIKVRMVGGGGGGGAATTNSGGTGGNTSFASWTAVGGGGGPTGIGGTGAAGGTGGTNSTGTLLFRATGAPGFTAISAVAGGAPGGNSFFGGAGKGSSANAAGANAVANSGSGGAGGANGSNAAGGGGAAGEYVEFIMTSAQIGVSQTYAIGTAGTGGAAGASAGGNGGSGFIIVEEYPF